MAGPSEGPLELTIKWGKEMVEVEVARDATVADLKDRIHQLTHVRIDRQRILGLKGMKVADEARLSEVLPSTAKPLVLIGCAACRTGRPVTGIADSAGRLRDRLL